jgi:hypothetical protein
MSYGLTIQKLPTKEVKTPPHKTKTASIDIIK